MSSRPRVTIVTLYYNRPDNVEYSIRSLIDQSYKGVHIIALDDGSSDDTLAAMRRLSAPNLEVRTQANKGFTPSIRDLMAGMDTEFIAVHGSGDISHPDRLARQVEALDNDPAAVMCVTASQTVDPRSGKSIGVRSFYGNHLKRSDIAETTPFTHGTVMYRRDAYMRAGGYEPSIKWCSDWDLWFRLLKMGHAHYVTSVLYDRLAQEDGVSFHPVKSIEQVKCKRLVLKLAELDENERADVVAVLKGEGLDAAVKSESALVARDLNRRQFKLRLMGRPTEAAMLVKLAAAEGFAPTFQSRALAHLADSVVRVGLPPERLIALGRRVIRKPARRKNPE